MRSSHLILLLPIGVIITLLQLCVVSSFAAADSISASDSSTPSAPLKLIPLATFASNPQSQQQQQSRSSSIFGGGGSRQKSDTSDRISVEFAFVSSTSSHSMFRPSSTAYHGFMELRVMVMNVGKAAAPQQLRLYVEDDRRDSPFFAPAVLTVASTDALQPNEPIHMSLKLRLTAHASLENIPSSLKFSVEPIVAEGQKQAGPLSTTFGHDRIQLSVDLFQSYFAAKYGTKKCYNILFFGWLGSGKSIRISTLISALSPRVRHVAQAGGLVKHRTQKLIMYRLHDLIGDDFEACVNIEDTWGLDESNWSEGLLQKVLDGQVPAGFSMHDQANLTLRVFNAEPIHAVVFFMTLDSYDLIPVTNRIKSSIEIASKRGMNPLVIATKADNHTPQRAEELRQELQLILGGIPVVLMHPYLEEDKVKSFAIDKAAVVVLDTALRQAQDFQAAQRMEPRVNLIDLLYRLDNATLPIVILAVLGLFGFLSIIGLLVKSRVAAIRTQVEPPSPAPVPAEMYYFPLRNAHETTTKTDDTEQADSALKREKTD